MDGWEGERRDEGVREGGRERGEGCIALEFLLHTWARRRAEMADGQFSF